MTEYFVRVKGPGKDGVERTLDLEPFSETDKDPERELGMARELGWAQACGITPMQDRGILFRKEGKNWKEVARVF